MGVCVIANYSVNLYFNLRNGLCVKTKSHYLLEISIEDSSKLLQCIYWRYIVGLLTCYLLNVDSVSGYLMEIHCSNILSTEDDIRFFLFTGNTLY